MEQQQEMNVSWSVVDGQPLAHVRIVGEMTAAELKNIRDRISEVLEDIDYFLAPFVGAGATGGRARKLHILRKEDFERDQKAARPLCGKLHEWGITFPLDDDPGLVNTCAACYRIATQELGGTWPEHTQQKSESEHGE